MPTPPIQHPEKQNITNYIQQESSPEEINISVIIPCFNAGDTINNCIDSILSQTESGIEIIAVNDGSSDSTQAILQKYETDNPGIVHVITQTNQGVSAARNAGIAAAKGRYIIFVDADDLLVDNTLSKIVAEALSDPTHLPDIVYCGLLIHDRNGGTSQSSIPSRPPQNIDYTFLANLDVLEFGAPWGKLYRRETLIKSEVTFDRSMPMYEDAQFNIRFAEKASLFMATNQPLYIYRRNFNSATSRFHGDKYMECVKEIFTRRYNLFVVKHNIDSYEPTVRRQLSYDCLMGLYSIYRSKRTHKKYNWLKRYCKTADKIDRAWSERLDSGIPKITGILIRRSKLLCHLWLSAIFGIEKLKRKNSN